MGGAERSARKRKQQRGAVGRAAAASRGTSRTTIVAVAAVIVLAAGVIGGIVWMNASKSETQGQAIPVASEPGKLTYPGERQGAVVVRGSDDAKVTIDIYEDFICPICGQFEKRYGDQIEEKIASGELRVRYHMVPLLTKMSDPPGYSLDAANATLCAADAGKFVPFHDSLFSAQPAEGGRGYSNSQLIDLGRSLGITGQKFASCVNSGKYNQELEAALNKAENNPDLLRTRNGRTFFGTPAVAVDGKLLNALNNPNWLSTLLAKHSK